MTVLERFISRAFRKAAIPLANVQAPLLGPVEISELQARVDALDEPGGQVPEVHYRHAGDFRSVYLGPGLDFEESRLYERGDDLRSMDWRTTARTGKPYVKVYREEHHPEIHIVVDRGPTMRFGTVERLKAAQAARVATIAAFVAMRRGACIGGTLVQPDGLSLPCASGNVGAYRLVEAAASAAPPLAHGAGGDSLWQVLEQIAVRLQRGARVVVASDFHGLDGDCGGVLMQLSARHQLIPIQILDRVESELPAVGHACFENPLTGRSQWLDTGAASLRREFALRAGEARAAADGLFAAMGVRLARIHADQDPFHVVLKALGHG